MRTQFLTETEQTIAKMGAELVYAHTVIEKQKDEIAELRKKLVETLTPEQKGNENGSSSSGG